MAHALRWLPLVSALCQLVGTALIVWGLKVVSNPTALVFLRDRTPGEPETEPPQPASIAREHPWAFTWGAGLLLLGLTLQVAAAFRV